MRTVPAPQKWQGGEEKLRTKTETRQAMTHRGSKHAQEAEQRGGALFSREKTYKK